MTRPLSLSCALRTVQFGFIFTFSSGLSIFRGANAVYYFAHPCADDDHSGAGWYCAQCHGVSSTVLHEDFTARDVVKANRLIDEWLSHTGTDTLEASLLAEPVRLFLAAFDAAYNGASTVVALPQLGGPGALMMPGVSAKQREELALDWSKKVPT